IYTLVYIFQVGGIGTGTGGIPFFLPGDQGLRDLTSYGTCLYVSLLVTDAPQEHRCAAPVAEDEAPELFEIFGSTVEQPVLIDYQETQAVAGIEPLGRRRVMAGPAGVGTHLFEQTGPVILQIIRQGTAYARMVL